MKLLLRALSVLASTVLIGGWLAWMWHVCGPRSIGYQFILVWFTMCWVTLVALAFPFRFPETYHALRRWEREGRRYESFGVLLAKRLLRRGPLHVFNPKLQFPKELDAVGVAKVEQRMRTAEANHVVMFLVTLLAVAHACVRGWWDSAAWIALFDVLINGYPVILQRYNRGRLAPLLARLRSAAAT